MDADYGITARLGIAMVLPLRLVSTQIRYLDAVTRAEVALASANIHHRDETLFGVGDPWLLGRYRGRLGRLSLGGRAGLSVPLGQTENDPFARGDRGLAHQHIQFGNGTINPVVAIDAGLTLGRVDLSVHALTIQVVYQSGRGYQAGDRYAAGVSGATRLGRGWTSALSVDVAGETAERWDGVIHDDEGNQGRLDLLGGAAITREIGDGVALRLGVKIPLVTRVVGGQLDYPALIDVGLRFAMGGAGPRRSQHGHEHGEHEHGEDGHDGDPDRHDSPVDLDSRAAIDLVEISRAGELVELVPVVGKITVFDFWAPWCKPCHALDRELRALARAYPGRLAIRTVNVVDWDSPAAVTQLGARGFDSLPHLKIFGSDGVLAIEAGGTAEDLTEQVRAMLAR